MPTQHRHSYLAGRVALDPDLPRVFSVGFVDGQPKDNNGGGVELRGR
jgi:hypothetical protein